MAARDNGRNRHPLGRRRGNAWGGYRQRGFQDGKGYSVGYEMAHESDEYWTVEDIFGCHTIAKCSQTGN